MCDDWEYLEDQHLLLAIKTADGLESYGCFTVVLYALSARSLLAAVSTDGEIIERYFHISLCQKMLCLTVVKK